MNTKGFEPVAPAGAGDHRSALLAGYLGWTLDAFDFFLVVMCLTAIGREFHKSDGEMALATVVTLAFRPVGAFLFGLLADRYGRRLPLMLDLIFYSIVEVASGLAPSYTTFMVLRALFGIGMGGEWGVGASLAMEKVPPRLRGLLSGILQQGYATGYLLAALCYFLLFERVGWRPLFFIGGLPALLALFVRVHVKESEVWKKTRQETWSRLGRARDCGHERLPTLHADRGHGRPLQHPPPQPFARRRRRWQRHLLHPHRSPRRRSPLFHRRRPD